MLFKKILFSICMLTLLLGFASCKKDSRLKNVAEISYGTSFGMCTGYCSNNLLIDNLQITFSKSKHGSAPDTKTCTNTITQVEKDALKALLSESKITTLPNVIGCPDCADGGAEWVAVKADGKLYKVTFEYGRAPAELAAAVAKLRALKESFGQCN